MLAGLCSLRGLSGTVLPGLFQLPATPAACGSISPASAMAGTWPSALCLCVLLCLFKGHVALDLRPSLIHYDLISILTLITSTKSLFPNQVPC